MNSEFDKRQSRACATSKLGILKIFPIQKEDALILISKYKTYACKVKCECGE